MRLFPVLRGADGPGLVIGALNWMSEGPPQPATQPATLELVTLYWVLGDDIVPIQQRVPRTPRIGTAALHELRS